MSTFHFSEIPVLKCKDHTVSGEMFELRVDEEYELLATFPRPKEEELPAYYKSENYISHTDSKSSFSDKIYQRVKKYMLRKKINWIESEKKGRGKILDFGAGTGDFLLEAKENAWEIFGTEPNPEARKLASEKNIDLQKDTSSFASESFDVITLWHVLEHVPDLENQIEELKRLLKKDGLLVIAVPNFKSYDAFKYQEHWAAFDVPRHLYHFSRTAIKKIFGGHSFEVVQEKPLWFDAFYVSLLSEIYKNGKFNLLKAFLAGVTSNQKANSTGEYSSLAYFLRKS